MTEFGRRKDGRVYPKGNRRKGQAISRKLTAKEIEDLTGVGIRHPGSLTDLGYHISEPESMKHAALNRAVRKYGMKETLRKLGELYRLDYNKPELKARIVRDIQFVSGGKRND